MDMEAFKEQLVRFIDKQFQLTIIVSFITKELNNKAILQFYNYCMYCLVVLSNHVL